MPRINIFIIFCVLTVTLAGCSTNQAGDSKTRAADVLTFTEAEYPRVDGSTATIPLAEAAAAVLIGKNRADCAGYADFTGTSSAYSRLANKEVDILIVYEAAQETKGAMAEDFKHFKQAAIGSDALVFLVNAANPVDNLTVDQIRGIYSGEITNWNQVGGDDAQIAAFRRNATAGSQALMESLVMGTTPMMKSPEYYMFSGMGELVTAVADFDTGQYSIGYNVFYYVTQMKNDPNVKILSVNGIAPDKEVIASGEYPLTNDFYAIIRDDEPEHSPASLMYNWLQSAEGQTLVDLEGYAAKKF